MMMVVAAAEGSRGSGPAVGRLGLELVRVRVALALSRSAVNYPPACACLSISRKRGNDWQPFPFPLTREDSWVTRAPRTETLMSLESHDYLIWTS